MPPLSYRSTLVLPVLLFFCGCPEFYAAYESPRGATILLGEDLVDLVRAVGPVSVDGYFKSDMSNQGGPRSFGTNQSVAEVCLQGDNVWVRLNPTVFQPHPPPLPGVGNYQISGIGDVGRWQRWDEILPGDRRTSVDLEVGNNFCNVQYDIGIDIRPLGEAFIDPDIEPEPFICKQSQGNWLSAPQIATGPTASFESACPGPLDRDQRPMLRTEGNMVDAPEGYPPDAPRP